MTLLAVAIGIAIGLKGPGILARAIYNFQNRRIMKDLVPQKVDPKKLCKAPHSWILATTFTDKGNGSVRICRVCGLVEGSNTAVTEEAIDRIEENNRLRQLEEKVYQEFTSKEDSDVRKYFDKEIKNGLSYEKLAKLHTAGMTFKQRYAMYKSGKKKEIEQELSRSNS